MDIAQGCALLTAAGAACMDLVTIKISNSFLLLSAAGALVWRVSCRSVSGLLSGFAGAAVPLTLFFVFFCFRMIGAGDVKLTAVLGFWMGAGKILPGIFAALLAGAALSLISFIRYRNFRERMEYLFSYIRAYCRTGTAVPYRSGFQKESCIHFAVPVLVSVLLWIGGVY